MVLRRRKPYENQLERVRRWKNRIDKVLNEYKQGELSVGHLDLADMICCFFTCCDHMKDYIYNDDTIETEQSPYEYIEENECLKVSRDICVGTKHLIIKNPKTSGGPFIINFAGKRDQKTEKMLVDVNIKSKTVHENFSKLADDCISVWEAYIKKEITSKPKKQIKINCPICKAVIEIDEDLIVFDCPKCKEKNLLAPKKT